MRVDDISVLGWLHTVACMVALFAGPLVLALAKGTRFHRRAGYLYAFAIGIASITALGLFAPVPGLPTFNRFHWMSIATLAMVALGVWAAQHQRRALGAYAHPLLMIGSYYMLIGGALNEAFARIGALRAAAMAGSPWAHAVLETRLLNQTQGITMLIFLGLIAWFMVKVARSRSRRAAAIA